MEAAHMAHFMHVLQLGMLDMQFYPDCAPCQHQQVMILRSSQDHHKMIKRQLNTRA